MKHSESVANIAAALCKFQASVTNPKKESINPHFKSKYADLDAIINAIRPTLKECGLAFIQNPVTDQNGNIGVYTMILHESGEFIEFDPVYIPVGKATPHQVGAAMTYARRYSLGAALGIATDEDDDGNSVDPKQPKQQEKQERQQRPQQQQRPQALATPQQLKKFFAMGRSEKGLTDEQLKKLVKYQTGKESSRELTKQEVSDLIRLMSEMTGPELIQLISEKAIESAVEDMPEVEVIDPNAPITDEEIEEAMNQ